MWMRIGTKDLVKLETLDQKWWWIKLEMKTLLKLRSRAMCTWIFPSNTTICSISFAQKCDFDIIVYQCFLTNSCQFVKNILKKEHFFKNSFFGKQIHKKWKFWWTNSKTLSDLPTIQKGTSNFLISYFECHQIWLNILMDDHNWSQITKLKNLKLLFFFWASQVGFSIKMIISFFQEVKKLEKKISTPTPIF